MPAGTIEIDIPRPIDEVFAYVGDLETAPQWVPDLVSMRKVTEGPVGVGTRYVEMVQMGKKQEEAQRAHGMLAGCLQTRVRKDDPAI